MFSDTEVLLDNQAGRSVFCNARLLTDTRRLERPVCIGGVDGSSEGIDRSDAMVVPPVQSKADLPEAGVFEDESGHQDADSDPGDDDDAVEDDLPHAGGSESRVRDGHLENESGHQDTYSDPGDDDDAVDEDLQDADSDPGDDDDAVDEDLLHAGVSQGRVRDGHLESRVRDGRSEPRALDGHSDCRGVRDGHLRS
jgi:hypothetical protein